MNNLKWSGEWIGQRLPESEFWNDVNSNKSKIVKQFVWSTDEDSLDKFVDEATVLNRNMSKNAHMVYGNLSGLAVLVVLYQNNEVNATIAADTEEEVDGIYVRLREMFPEQDNDTEGFVRVKFWANAASGPFSISRKIEVPGWDSIRGNYGAELGSELHTMMREFKPSHGGQLLLWEGKPGTGKTYALRALAEEWKDWANFHYISDPEEFFGSSAYMFQVLLSETNDYLSFLEDGEEELVDKWTVLILEDCGELLTADAKERTGQAVSRLLNVVDGLIGQGLRILVLATTNEPVKKFHPAIHRPGRCAAHLHYSPLSAEDANRWLEEQGSSVKVRDEKTLAELFAIRDGYENDQQIIPVGFVGAA